MNLIEINIFVWFCSQKYFLCILFSSREISYSTIRKRNITVFYECNKNSDLYLLRLILTPPDLVFNPKGIFRSEYPEYR